MPLIGSRGPRWGLLPGEIISAARLECLRGGLAADMHRRGVADAILRVVEG